MKIRRILSVILFSTVLFLFPLLIAGAEECPRNEEYEKARSIAQVKEWKVLSLERYYKPGNVFWARMIVEGTGSRREFFQISRFRDVLETIVSGDVVKIELVVRIHLGDGMFNQDGKSGSFPAECVTEEYIPGFYKKRLQSGDYLMVTGRLKDPS